MGKDKFKNITLQQLEILLALVEAGSFTRAAGKLFLSQPSLTKQIQNLEEAAGARLVNRSAAGNSVTPEGRIIYDYARRMIRLREDAKDRVMRLKDQESGHIYVSASTIPATYILPNLLGRLKEIHPAIQVHVQMHDSEETLQTVLNDQAEMGFIGKAPTNMKLISTRLWKDTLLVVVPASHELAKQKSVRLGDFTKVPFIIREKGSGTRDLSEECLQKQLGMNLSAFNVICEMGSSEAIKEAILAGLGVSILSSFAIRREMAQGLLTALPVSNCHMDRYFYLVHKKQFPLMTYHKNFVDIVKRYSPLE
ncbi:MAG TPA: selenium metabolism-associated LysR family transcriptional regulator [Syntrophales bacterium]|nr:selenium metabolism-associated LysR family transcriptional regulator [Syntrophales bacterium]